MRSARRPAAGRPAEQGATTSGQPPTRLARRLGLGDAVTIGLGSMTGAGVFVAVGPAARAAGSGLLLGLGLAAIVAACNASSSATLAARWPASGGAYVYGRRQLGAFWGYLAGWGFVVGKLASCAAVTLTIGAHVAPSQQRPVAVIAVVALCAVNYVGVRKTVAFTRVIVALVLIALATAIAGCLLGGTASTVHIGSLTGGGAHGTLQSAAVLFFAFAGYARITTLGEEVVDPARNIRRAIRIALGITVAVYVVVAVSAIAAVGPDLLAASPAPLADAVEAGDLGALGPIVRAGGAIAGLGVLLSLIAGIARTTFAMAADGELPGWLAGVHPVHRVPHHAVVAAGAMVILIVAAADIRHAIGFSSFCVLAYYAIANAAAWRLRTARPWTRPIAAAGIAGCTALAVALPLADVVAGTCVLAAGASVRVIAGASSERDR